MRAGEPSAVGTSRFNLPILFVCGLHRSGTSALARLLGSAAGVRGMTRTGVPEDEGQHLQSVVPTAAAHGGPGLFAFDPGAHLTERSQLATRQTALTLLDAWLPYWHLNGDNILGWRPAGALVVMEKSPPNLIRTRFLQALFPNARFVVLLRHPAVVTVSTARWRPGLAPATLLRHWSAAHGLFGKDAPHLNHVSVLRYEDLVGEPETALTSLAEALDLSGPFDVGLLETGLNERHLQAWRSRSSAVTGAERRAIQRGIESYGYSLDPPYVHLRD
jgi:hypothetical protein